MEMILDLWIKLKNLWVSSIQYPVSSIQYPVSRNRDSCRNPWKSQGYSARSLGSQITNP